MGRYTTGLKQVSLMEGIEFVSERPTFSNSFWAKIHL